MAAVTEHGTWSVSDRCSQWRDCCTLEMDHLSINRDYPSSAMTEKSNSPDEPDLAEPGPDMPEGDPVDEATDDEEDPAGTDTDWSTRGTKQTDGVPAVSSSGTGPPVSSEDADIIADDELQSSADSTTSDHVSQDGQERGKEVIDNRARDHEGDDPIDEAGADDGVSSVEVDADEPPIDPDANIAAPKNKSQDDSETETDE